MCRQLNDWGVIRDPSQVELLHRLNGTFLVNRNQRKHLINLKYSLFLLGYISNYKLLILLMRVIKRNGARNKLKFAVADLIIGRILPANLLTEFEIYNENGATNTKSSG